MTEKPIFIIGTERSGSNLLRLILNSHPNIAIPHPPHIMRYFSHLEGGYGDLSGDRAFRVLVRDIRCLVENHIHPWDLPIDNESLMRMAPSRSVFGVKAALYENYRASTAKPRWGCKSTFLVDHAPVVLKHYPHAQFVLLVRDPRDVAVSSRKSVFSTYHPYFTASLWRDQQLKGLDLLDSSASGQTHVLHYEKLLSDPENTLRQLCSFLGEEFEPNMLRYFETSEARRSAALSASWSNTTRPIMQDNAGKYRHELSPQETAVVECVAQVPMRRLGYVPEHDGSELERIRPGVFDVLRYWKREQSDRLRVELHALKNDSNVLQRWKRDTIVRYFALRHSFRPVWRVR